MTGVSELVLEVADLERAERFYTEMLGLPVVERWPHRDAVWVLAGQTRIGLWEPQVGLEGSRGGEHVHFAMQIAPTRTSTRIVAALRESGHEVPVHEFGAARRRREPEPLRLRHRPDGHLVEFWTARMSDYEHRPESRRRGRPVERVEGLARSLLVGHSRSAAAATFSSRCATRRRARDRQHRPASAGQQPRQRDLERGRVVGARDLLQRPPCSSRAPASSGNHGMKPEALALACLRARPRSRGR